MKRSARNRVVTSAFVALLLGCFLLGCSGTHAQGPYTAEGTNEYASKQDWDGLLRYTTEWTRAEPNSPLGWYYLGSTYGRVLKQPGKSVPAFERAVALQPQWPEAWNALGFENVALQRYDEAIKAFTHAVQQAPTRANYWNSLAAAYSFQNRFSMAVKTLEDEQRAIAGSTQVVDWYNLGNGFCTMEEFTLAAAAYRRALQLNPGYAAVWNNLGTIEGVAGNNEAALNDYQRAAALGDQAGANNYARLQQAIAAEKERNNPDLLHRLWHSQGVELESRARQAWQDRLARAQN